MKNQFKGHFSTSDAGLKKVWKEGVFVFDANVLLNFYRYSEGTRKQFLGLLKKECKRCWLPEQCGAEYLSRRLKVISDQVKKYTEVSSKLEGLQTEFDGQKGHPFLESDSLKGLKKTITDLKSELSQSEKDVTGWINEDPIKEAIAEIFEGRVGEPLTGDELEKVFSEGEDRYERKIPPGYMDANKSPNAKTIEDKKRKFGDLLFWKQILAMAKADKKPIILITDDNKEDWWLSANGRTVGPRPELLGEFCSETEQEMLIYTPFRFLELAKKNLGEKITSTAIEEVKEEEKNRDQGVTSKYKYMLKYYEDVSAEFQKSVIDKLPDNTTFLINKINSVKEKQRKFLILQLDKLNGDLLNLQLLNKAYKSNPTDHLASGLAIGLRELNSNLLELKRRSEKFNGGERLNEMITNFDIDVMLLESESEDILASVQDVFVETAWDVD
ncbi:PIN domain-containing protein [Pseudovibrio sp. Tun.PSC04-5.I4]|uniref:PIN domain-containing protein n=1 Tax=Pseudovibrio sp. Tun.PSC04-5.I4 TaxID=1798213 RepID=UPI00088A8ADD|nr:PIN domain-containing protein [Pseudovibrio sp. Tun.PSC04-5.I4]SDR15697.1 hypothetical protein SAMN04515695_3068 [Pseudovibrio sp. Tun.PSC04-5.I4]